MPAWAWGAGSGRDSRPTSSVLPSMCLPPQTQFPSLESPKERILLFGSKSSTGRESEEGLAPGHTALVAELGSRSHGPSSRAGAEVTRP